MILISAIICTYNRAQLLSGALDSLVQQSLDLRCYEIIVVDNASNDETSDVIRTFQEKYREHTIVHIYEPKQGLGYARNTGLRNARGKYVAYLDDDARADPAWLKTALELFETVTPSPICVGGPILPFYDVPKPLWFKDAYEIRNPGNAARWLGPGEAFSGSNMVWRKESAMSLEGFEVSLGVKGNHLSLGEETALFDKVWHSSDQPSLYYCPQLSIQHRVAPPKMSVSYQLKREVVRGQVWERIYGPKTIGSRLVFLVRLLWGIAKVGTLALWRGRTYDHWQNWLIEECKPVMMKIGILFRLVGLTVSVRQR